MSRRRNCRRIPTKDVLLEVRGLNRGTELQDINLRLITAKFWGWLG